MIAVQEGTDTCEPHSHNQTLTVGLGITPSLLSSISLTEISHLQPTTVKTFAPEFSLKFELDRAPAGYAFAITAGGDFHPALRIFVK